MDNRRTETARATDDSATIDRDSSDFEPRQSGGSGGNLQEDIATKAELERVRDPEAHHGIDKQNKIDHQLEANTNRPGDSQPGGKASD